ncbi:MAG: radical SAM protein [Deltaproteobacteria bacterium]|nr:radical SAM protein [Deltaproteobacteria bacterium]MBW2016415.1 radical SAM protein [Deltaproteobacteria bacterium]MBW2305255.1 radical SAM protein [Deltaproteobacteria bacterium]
MKSVKKKILFLQLPRLDNDTGKEDENLPMAGFYLSWALEKAGMERLWEIRGLTPEQEELDDAHLLRWMAEWRPDILCATLYLWNIERTLHLARKLKERLPDLRIIFGGPEVAPGHPFLFKSRVPDVVVAGEGEFLFPFILKALHRGEKTNFNQVAWKGERQYHWGTTSTPSPSLSDALPPPEHPCWRPDPRGTAYLETGRGCPLRCTYCRYPHMRDTISFLTADDVIQRAHILVKRGARQIRFVDPTLNANPRFRQILQGLKELRRNRHIDFFAEVRADVLGEDDVMLLREAGFTELEAGVQSRDANVLRRVRRPLRIDSLERNIRLMTREGIRVTIDLMYGLPGQRKEEVLESIEWAWGFRHSDVQCLQTLLLPGTDLKGKARTWQMKAGHRPPYGVISTKTLSFEDIQEIEEYLNEKQASDCMTQRFVGYRLPDLFAERIGLSPGMSDGAREIPGCTSRRALLFQGTNLYSMREWIRKVISRAIQSEPHMLWQFILRPETEEPLDLIEEMIAEIRKYPVLWLDRFACVKGWDRIASRRIFILLKRGGRYSPAWKDAAETLLEDNFY